MQRRILPLSEQDTPGLLQALARVPDPRDAGGRIHPLPGLLAIAAVVSGIEPRRSQHPRGSHRREWPGAVQRRRRWTGSDRG